MYSRLISTTAALSLIAPNAFAGQSNPPWYPSLQAFEHYDSGRSHVFSQAEFLGSNDGRNMVLEVHSKPHAYPSGYNTSYLNENEAFIQGGSYGDVPGSIGPFVAKVDPQTLDPVWFTLLRNTQEAGEWDYPGGMAIMNDGYIYVVSGYRMYKVNPANASYTALVLPTMVEMRNNYPTNPPAYDNFLTDDATNTSYNGLNALPDGTVILKSLYRVAGCTNEGGSAVLSCPDSRNVPRSFLLSVNPTNLQLIDQVTLPAFAGARPTISHYNGVDYVYLLESTSTARRYTVTNGIFTLDESWQPPAVANCGQQPGGSLIVLNDWIVGALNTAPATEPLTVFAIHQGNASNYFTLQPYANDPLAPELKLAFAHSAPNVGSPACTNGVDPLATNLPAVSWAMMSLEADPENGLFYGVETLARKVAAFRISPTGIKIVWKQTQTTTEWATLIGPKEHRVWVGTDIPIPEIPGQNHFDMVVWRDASTGRELARSGMLPAMTGGSAVQPGYDGSMLFPGAEGMLIRLTPIPERNGQGKGPK